MADHTTIEWTDATWNVITGCSVVSAGCKNCYAMKLAGSRLQHHPSRVGLTQPSAAGPVWNGQVRFNEEWLDQPLRWKRPRQIFVCAHGDLFHESVPSHWIHRVLAVMLKAPQHTFQVLTKRADRMRKVMKHFADVNGGPMPNVWCGVSVEDQAAANQRVPELLATPAAVHWISAEPLLGHVDLTAIVVDVEALAPDFIRVNHPLELNALGGRSITELGIEYAGNRIDWVVAGGESGRAARPMHPDWVRSLRDQCSTAGTAFHFKQWGEFAPGAKGWLGGTTFTFADGRMVQRVGKKAAGRVLDDRTHDEFPRAA